MKNAHDPGRRSGAVDGGGVAAGAAGAADGGGAAAGAAGAADGDGAAAAPAASTIVLNGEPCNVAPGVSVAELLRGLGLEPGMVVVERNRTILARRDLAETPVEDGDRFELVHFVGGG